MAKLFEVSLDTLCGLQADDMTIMETARQIAAHDENASFEELLNCLERLKMQLATDPLHEELLMYVLEFAAVIHDRCDSDAQKDRINDEIEALAQRVLDFSGSDDYRSIANYRLALCYLERVDRVRASEDDRRCAQKAKEYADRVLYKDMDAGVYEFFGAVTLEEELEAREEALLKAVASVQRAVRNLQRRYMYAGGKESEKKTVQLFSEQLEHAARSLTNAF